MRQKRNFFKNSQFQAKYLPDFVAVGVSFCLCPMLHLVHEDMVDLLVDMGFPSVDALRENVRYILFSFCHRIFLIV